MKSKVKQALRSLLEDVAVHDSETSYSAVEVDKEELKTLLRWAQNSAHVWFEGDRVKRTGASVPFDWLNTEMEGTVMGESDKGGSVRVEWDNGPEGDNRVVMYHNEIKRIK